MSGSEGSSTKQDSSGAIEYRAILVIKSTKDNKNPSHSQRAGGIFVRWLVFVFLE